MIDPNAPVQALPEVEVSGEPVLGFDFGELTSEDRAAIEDGLIGFMETFAVVQNSMFQTLRSTIESMTDKEF